MDVSWFSAVTLDCSNRDLFADGMSWTAPSGFRGLLCSLADYTMLVWNCGKYYATTYRVNPFLLLSPHSRYAETVVVITSRLSAKQFTFVNGLFASSDD